MTAISIHLDQLPTAIREQTTLADAGSDARHLEALIDSSMEKLVGMMLPDPVLREDLNRAIALLYVARDLAETLEWKLDRMERGGIARLQE